MMVVIAYDIEGNRRRDRVCNTLKDFGERVQYSVFECEITADQLKELRERVGSLINGRRDSVRYYILCVACRDKVICQGKKP